MTTAELTRAGKALSRARSNLAVATYDAKTVAVDAAAEGFSEVRISQLLGVDRLTVRAWLGKPRKRPQSGKED